jgi:GDP-L-fucose synthase|tara:strand:- start:2180 stop:3124 length:945 start_codon:yes stop_codon:yes gene_type:complete
MKKYKNAKIFLAGHNGLVGSAIYQRLISKGFKKIITKNRKELDLRDSSKVKKFLAKNKPEYIIIAAARVGGIKANNDQSGEFIFENLTIQNNLIDGGYRIGVKKLIFLGSSCIYPKFSKQPIKEKYLLESELEKTNEAYAIAKIAGVKLCEYYNKQYSTNFLSLMPCNTFGKNDNYNLDSSHFLPALIKKIYLAKIKNKNFVELWGNGKTLRELIYVDDVADAVVHFLFKKTKHHLINIGTEKEMTIENYAKIIMKILNLNLKIKYINKKLTGTPRKVLDCSLAKSYKWKSKIKIEDGLKTTIKDFKKNFKTYV